jgi:hypothetical protein
MKVAPKPQKNFVIFLFTLLRMRFSLLYIWLIPSGK